RPDGAPRRRPARDRLRPERYAPRRGVAGWAARGRAERAGETPARLRDADGAAPRLRVERGRLRSPPGLRRALVLAGSVRSVPLHGLGHADDLAPAGAGATDHPAV